VTSVQEGGIACPFRAATGVVCPFCNMTHATFALGRGDLAASLDFHPLGPLVLLMWMWGALELSRRRSSRVARHRPAPLILAGLVAVIWIANLVAAS